MTHTQAEKVLQQLLRQRRGMLDAIKRQGRGGQKWARYRAIAAKTCRNEIEALEYALVLVEVAKTVVEGG